MSRDRKHWNKRGIRRPVIGALAGLTVLGSQLVSSVQADPADDAVAKLNELSRQAEQTTEAMHAAQLDLNNKLSVEKAAEAKHTADQATLDSANTRLSGFQASVDKAAAAEYMGGRTSGLDAILTADSPQQLIDHLAVQRVMATEIGVQMAGFRTATVDAAKAEAESSKSAADAKSAAEQAAKVRAELQAKQSKLQVQIAIVKSHYMALTPNQREALAALPPAPPPQAAPPAPEGTPPPPEGAPPAPEDPAINAEGPNQPDALPPSEGGSSAGAIAVQAALTRIGDPYSWGAAGPGAFDCSGLVMWAFQQAGISLPHSSYAQAAGGQPVSRDAMQPGDVITYYSDASHVGIYIGDGMMVHASTFGVPVRVAPVNNAPIYNVRRY